MTLEESLKISSGGGALLFCGAGFSAGCLNFKNAELGASSPLLKAMNDALQYGYNDIQIAADEYAEKKGEHGLFQLLQDKYSVQKRTKEIDEVLKYPWTRIYTTNYDDVISQSLTSSGKSHYVANNTESPFEVAKLSQDQTWVVHLHGSLKKWDFKSFTKSCVLGRESYLKISNDFKWSETLHEDYARANAVFFIGFSNSDFYLAQNLYSAEASKGKVFFINSERSVGDRELISKQKKYGTPLAIGSERFAQMVSEARKADNIPQIELHSFVKVELPKASANRASVPEQEAFMISGAKDYQLHYRDILDGSQSYRAIRPISHEISDFLTEADAQTVALILGGICSGKTTIFDEVILDLLTKGKIVFRLNAKFYDFLDEARKIITSYPSAILAIDNCFSIKTDLDEILERAAGAGSSILLSSRTLAYDSEPDLRSRLLEDTRFQTFDTEVLNEQERGNVIHCADRIGVWGTEASSPSDKVRLIEKKHHSRLSSFLLGVFNSTQVRDRFRSELDHMIGGGEAVKHALIVALYLNSIGEQVDEYVLSALVEADSVKLFREVNNSKMFIRFVQENQTFEVLPGVNAREALKKFFDPKDVTNSIVSAVRAMEDLRYEPAFKRVFTEFMRYTQLKQVISDFDQQNRFFDQLSELSFCHKHVLFWLQWSMAMRDHKNFPKADQYLNEAYGRAQSLHKFDTSHLDDQKAGLLLEWISDTGDSFTYLMNFRDAIGLLKACVQRGESTSHNYITMRSLDGFCQKAKMNLREEHRDLIVTGLVSLGTLVQKKLDVQFQGFVKDSMENALEIIKKNIEYLKIN